MYYADVDNTIEDMDKVEDFGSNESTSLVRMRELGVKISLARHEKFTSKWRSCQRTQNWHSQRTLMYMLKGGLCTCAHVYSVMLIILILDMSIM
jgi:hypothetical protein